MSDCLFCQIVDGVVPSRKIFENDNCYAFLDIFPAAKGHTLVIPKKHFADIHEIDAHSYASVAAAAKEVADLLHARLGSDGTTIFQMNREAGWQTVFHLHVHVIPRWDNDGLHKPWDIVAATDGELAAVHKEVVG
jgi:histidine triad (HIT) family protein